MNSQSDETSRFHSASEQARHGLEQARRYFDNAGDFANPYLQKVGGKASRGWHWLADNTPGGQRTLWIIVGLILLVIFVWAIVPGSKTTGLGAGMNGPQPVGVALAARGDIDITLNALGTVTPLATVTVRPQVSGQLRRIAFREGQLVNAGDLLAGGAARLVDAEGLLAELKHDALGRGRQ